MVEMLGTGTVACCGKVGQGVSQTTNEMQRDVALYRFQGSVPGSRFLFLARLIYDLRRMSWRDGLDR